MGDNGSDKPLKSPDLGLRILVVVVGALAGGSGLVTISATDDRIRAQEVERMLEIRDVQIRALREQLDGVRDDVDRIDQNGPAVGNQDFNRRINDLEDELKALRRGG